MDERAVDSVMRAIDLVEQRMGEDIAVEDMARAACCSLFDFSRLFAQATGHSPNDYLMRRRVAVAAADIVAGGRSLTELALDRGFEVPDTFARAFRRCFGLLPSEARRDGRYPSAIASTAVSRSCVEALLGGAISPPERAVIGGECLDGRRADPAASPRPGASRGPILELRELDENGTILRSFLGGPSAEDAVPDFPCSRTALPRVAAARFALRDARDLRELRNFVYRAWLPLSGRTEAPAFEILEISSGRQVALLIPLESCWLKSRA